MIKRIALPLAVALMPMLASAQPYTEDLNLINGSKGQPLLCKRVDTAAAQTDTDGDASFCSANSLGAIQVNLDSAFQSGTSLVRSEDAAHTSGQPGIMALAVRNDALSTLTGTDGDYSPIAVGPKGNVFTSLWYDSSIGSAGPIRLEDGTTGDANPIVMIGAARKDVPAISSGTDGDVSFINSSGQGALWASLTPSIGGGWTPVKSTALTNSAVTIKASAGTLGGYHCYNPSVLVSYVQIYDNAGAITVGTTTPTLSFGLPASGGGNLELSNGLNFAAAIKVAASTTATGGTAPGTALECNFFYK